MKILATTHGLPRHEGGKSEDAFRVLQREQRLIAVLTDGLGASQEGGPAAHRAVAMLVDYYLARPQAWSPRRALSEFTTQINRLFYQESQQKHGSSELLCTLSAVAIEGGHLYGVNIGDSPVYLWRKEKLTQLSVAHTMADPGMNHVLTKAVGLEAEVEPHFFEAPIEDGDMILLCSDGVSNALSAETITGLLSRRSAARAIVSTAHEIMQENTELRDDTSAVILDIAQRGWTTSEKQRPLEVLPALRAKQLVDNYTLIRSLQEGARVWLAERGNEKHVLKFPPLDAAEDEARRDAFIREMWQATRIDSPDFVRAFIPEEGSLRYYAMEYVSAPTLHEAIQKNPLRVEEVVELARFLLRAGQFLASRDQAHGDIKPENIMVLRSESGIRFQMLDLGSAAAIFSVTNRAGTPSYLAPERFHGGALSERTEIFAIGVTLYRALSKSFPYGEIERFQTPRFESTPKRLTRLNNAVPGWLETVIKRAIAPESENRYQSFSEMAFDLDHTEEITRFIRKDAPLLERNPLLFYKVLCLIFLATNFFLLWKLFHVG